MPELVSKGRFALRPEVVATVMEDGAVVLDLRSRYFYSLNRSAWAILQQFEEGADLDEVRRGCAGGAAGDVAAVEAYLAALLADDLLMPANGAPVSGSGASPSAGNPAEPWTPPTITRHSEPLQRVMVSAFDPSLPLAE